MCPSCLRPCASSCSGHSPRREPLLSSLWTSEDASPAAQEACRHCSTNPPALAVTALRQAVPCILSTAEVTGECWPLVRGQKLPHPNGPWLQVRSSATGAEGRLAAAFQWLPAGCNCWRHGWKRPDHTRAGKEPGSPQLGCPEPKLQHRKCLPNLQPGTPVCARCTQGDGIASNASNIKGCPVEKTVDQAAAASHAVHAASCAALCHAPKHGHAAVGWPA